MRYWILSGLLLAGCATVGADYNPAVASALPPGTTVEQAIAQLGAPTSRATGPTGSTVISWTHAKTNGFTGKMESRAVMLLFDEQGHLVRKVGESDMNGKF